MVRCERRKESEVEPEEYSPTERQQFRYILSKIAFTGRCVPQIGRRFHWLQTHDDTWWLRIAAFRLAETAVLCISQ